MANMIDYLVWRGDFTLEQTPWCAIDALIAASLSYLNFHGMDNAAGWTLSEAKRIDLLQKDPGSPTFPNRERMFEVMADCARFSECRMHHFIALTDPEREMQFSAMCLDLPDGTMAVAFRGTDNTLVGWKEDFNMAYQPVVPAQEAAAYYLKRAAEINDRPLRLVGHSKGGNLSVYAATCAAEAVQNRIQEIYSFDGPGLCREMAENLGYAKIREKIRSYIPQTSIIGMLMEYYRPYTVVRSSASGISQHDPMTWEVYGPRFVELEKVDQSAMVICETLHEMLENSPPEERGIFVETLFHYLESTKATRMSEVTREKLKSLVAIMGNRKGISPETRRVFNRLVAQTVALGFGNVVEMVRNRREPETGAQTVPEAAPEAAQEAPEEPENGSKA